LISGVVLTPDASVTDGLRVELYGELAEIIALSRRRAAKTETPRNVCSED